MITVKKITAGAAGTADVRCETENGVTAFYVTAEAESGAFPAEAAVKLTLGLPEKIDGRMADVLYTPYWCHPEFGRDFSDLSPNTQALLWKETDGPYGCILPVADGAYVTTLCAEEGEPTAVVFSWCDSLKKCEVCAFVAAEGEDPYALLAQCAAEAARRLGNGLRLRGERRYPEIFEYLGWCSWDALMIWINEEDLLEKCREFREKNIPVRWAILDDMWADIEWKKKLPKFAPRSEMFPIMGPSKMRSFEADPERFPHGLDGCIARMKERYGMKVGVWHPTCGYWSGLMPGGRAAAKLADVTVRARENMILPDLGDPGRTYKYFAAMHAYFRACGADFVKIDCQSLIRTNYKNMFPVGDAARNLHAGIEGSVGAYFDGALINCMCMASENMFHRTTTAVTRCSDDFQPEDRAWFAKHISQCSYNGLVQGQFTYGDWDMWWSDDEQAMKNSILRALSGGPIYVSDPLGRSRPEIFTPLCFSDGRILRADRVAVPTKNCLLTDCTEAAQPLTVFNFVGDAAYVAAFNLHTDGTAVDGRLTREDIPGLSGGTLLLYEYFSGEWRLLAPGDEIAFTLRDADDFRLYSLTPIRDGIAVIGDAGKFLSARAVSDAGRGYIRMIEGGRLKLYSEKPILSVTDGRGEALPFTWKDGMAEIPLAAADTEIHYTT